MAWPRGTPPAPVLSVQFLRKCTPEGRPRRRTMAGRGRGGRAVAQRGVGRGGRLHAIAALPEAWAASRGAVGVPRTGTVGVVAVRSARTASGPSTLTPSTRHARRSTAPEWSPTASCRGDRCHGSPTSLASKNFVEFPLPSLLGPPAPRPRRGPGHWAKAIAVRSGRRRAVGHVWVTSHRRP